MARQLTVRRFLGVTFLVCLVGLSNPGHATTGTVLASALAISGVTANASSVPLYQKFELTFNVDNTVATNLQFPYDPAPPVGLTPGVGLSVQALFLAPGQTDWSQAWVQPGFLYQDYQRQQIGGQEWLYPNGNPTWKIRFAPKIQGTWQYQVEVQDASICAPGVNPCTAWQTSVVFSFTALPPNPGSHGFVQTSPTDSRYLSFTDGTRFVGLGLNTSFSLSNFTYDAASQINTYEANGVQLLRVWMDGSDIAGSAWNPWVWFGGPSYGGYLYDPGLWVAPTGSGYDFDFDLTQGVVNTTRTCIFNGFTQGGIAVKPSTSYKLKVTAQVADTTGPRNPSNPNYGFTAKIGGWPNVCPDDLSSSPNLVPYLQNPSPADSFGAWTTLQGTITTTVSQNFLSYYLYLILDNTNTGQAHVSQVTLQEILPDGTFGPNLLMKSQGNVHTDFNLLRSWDWDYVLDQAAQQNVFFKLVTLEKSDRVWDFINFDGTMNGAGGETNFHAQDNTKVRQLHYYFYRYLAARWGYSTAVQSWEVNNESDPSSSSAYDQVNKLAGFMHRWDSNHQVSMSFWSSYPAQALWNNASYPNPDYADLHAYSNDSLVAVDRHDAAALYIANDQYVKSQGVLKPTIRGETGIVDANFKEDPLLVNDTHGVWIHNLTWAQFDSGGMYDQMFYTDDISKNNLYFQYAPVQTFLSRIPLDNGHYQDAQAQASASNTRVVGQKDLVNGRGHLWIQNKNHEWYNVVSNIPWGTLTGIVTVPGFAPNQSYPIEWWEFDDPGNLTVVKNTITADSSGNLVLDLTTLPRTVTDTAVKIGDYSTAFVTKLVPILK